MMRGRRSKSGPSPQLETKSRGPSDVWGEKRCVLSSPRQSPASARGVCTATAGCRGRVGAHAHGAHSGCWALRSFSRRVSALACFFIHPASPSQAFPNGLEAEAQIPPSAEGPLSPVSPHSREPWGDSWRDSKEKNLTSGHRTDFLSSHFFYGGKILPSQPCLMCNPVVLSTFPLLGNPHHNHLQNSVPPAKPKLRPHPAPPPRPAAPGSRRPPPPPVSESDHTGSLCGVESHGFSDWLVLLSVIPRSLTRAAASVGIPSFPGLSGAPCRHDHIC